MTGARAVVSITVLLAAANARLMAGASSAPPAPAPAKTVPQAVQALSQVRGHVPVKGDTGPTSWSTGTFLYDPSGNLIVAGSHYFIYDAQSRLTNASIDTGGASQQQGYWYDEYGNMNYRQYPGQAWISIGVDAGSNHLTGNSVQYDDAGNVTNWSGNGDSMTYTYDGLRMIQQVTDTNGHNLMYIYTADDQRVWNFDYAGNSAHWRIRDLEGKVLRDFTQNNQGQWGQVKDYFYRNGLLLASSIPNTGAVTHFSLDHLGSPRLLTDQNGGKVAFHTYWPFGDEWTDGSPQESPVEVMKFTGQERDTDLSGAGDSLDYMHARFFATGSNRFLSLDPVLGDPAAPQSWNRYTYARNSPMVLTDPTGEYVDIAGLTAAERNKLIAGLNAFTGNTYDVDPNNADRLILVSVGTNSSATATAYVDGLIQSSSPYTVAATTKPGESWYNAAQNRIEIDFSSFDGAIYNGINSDTFNLGSTAYHEWHHQTTGLFDTPDGQRMTPTPQDQSWTGPQVDAENVVRTERGLPTRLSYYSSPVRPAGFLGFFGIGAPRSGLRFLDPQTGRVRMVIRNVP